MWEIINQAGDIVILIGAIIVAIKTIFSPILSSTKFATRIFKNKRDVEVEEMIKKVMSEEVPLHLKDIKELNELQTEKIEEIQKDLSLLKESETDNLRAEINRIYYKYLPYQKIYDYDKRAVMEMFHDYAKLGGNSYIHEVMNDIKEWDVVANTEKL